MKKIAARRSGFVLASCIILLRASPSTASDPSLARYEDDPSNIFWFVHVADTHIDNNAAYYDGSNFEWTLGEAFEIVEPLFVVNAGDLTDSSDGLGYWLGPQESEWAKYEEYIEASGLTADEYFDIIGNHDTYADEGALHFLTRSVQGREQGTTQPDWRIELPFGSYHFVGIATTCNDWAPWPFDNTTITDEEHEEILTNLRYNTDSNITVVIGHHDYMDVGNADRMDDLLDRFDVPLYLHGHEHSYGVRISERGVIRMMAGALGKSMDDNFCVWAIDSDAFSHTCVSALDPWPLIVVTAPVDAVLGEGDDVTNPYAPPVPLMLADAPLRVLVFDSEPVERVAYRWDTGLEGTFEQSGDIPQQWLAAFDASGFEGGFHDLAVEASGSAERTVTVQVLFGEEEPMEEDVEEAEEPAAEGIDDAEETVPEAIDAEPVPDSPDDAVEEAEEEEPDDANLSGSGCACRIPAPRAP